MILSKGEHVQCGVSKDSGRIPAIFFAIVLVWCKRSMLVSLFLRAFPFVINRTCGIEGVIMLEKAVNYINHAICQFDGASIRSASGSGPYFPGCRAIRTNHSPETGPNNSARSFRGTNPQLYCEGQGQPIPGRSC